MSIYTIKIKIKIKSKIVKLKNKNKNTEYGLYPPSKTLIRVMHSLCLHSHAYRKKGNESEYGVDSLSMYDCCFPTFEYVSFAKLCKIGTLTRDLSRVNGRTHMKAMRMVYGSNDIIIR